MSNVLPVAERRYLAAFKKFRREELGATAQEILLTCLEGEARASDLARAAGVSTSAITAAVDRLEERGLVGRKHCTDDRRAVMVFLTVKGRQVLRGVFERRGVEA